jgi:arsenate reductase-like glutaredoxin family protein
MNNPLRDSIKSLLQKFNVDPKSVGMAEDIKLEAEAKLADGSSVYTSAESFAVGADCYVKDADGNATPCAPGEYPMEDGSILVIDENAMIVEIKEMELEPSEQEMSSSDILAIIDSMGERISALESKNNELSAELSEAQTKLSEANDQLLKSKVELSSLRKAPATTSVKEKSVKFSAAPEATEEVKPFELMTYQERVLSNLKNFKKTK